MSTKKTISDAVLFKLAGGYPDGAFPVDERDIWSSLEQKINAKFKLRQFDTNLPAGETIPSNLHIAIYEGVAVASVGEASTSTLPITPISLPMEMGIFLVYDSRYPDNPFIPLRRGQRALMRADNLLSDLFGQITYDVTNRTLRYNKDLTLLGCDEVTMELIVFDMSQYSVTDVLPIPADYEAELEDELVREFAPVTPESGIVNPITTANQNLPKQ